MTVHCAIDHLDDIGDVNAAVPANNDALTWDAVASEWVPQAMPAGRQIATGSYVGNGAAFRQIAVGFKCSLVIIQNTDLLDCRVIIIPNMTIFDDANSDNTDEVANNYLHAADGFVVNGTGGAQDMNAAPAVYYYWAISE